MMCSGASKRCIWNDHFAGQNQWRPGTDWIHYTSQMDNLLLYRWSWFVLDSLIACMVLMSWYIGIHSNTNFKGQELMEFKSFVLKLWCHSRMSCDQENAMSTSSNTSSQATDQIIVNKQAQVLNGQCTSLSLLRLFGYVLADWKMV